MRSTYTFATLEISNAAFREIIDKLRAAGYQDQFIEQNNGVTIDMHGIALVTTCDHNSDSNATFAPHFCMNCGARLDA